MKLSAKLLPQIFTVRALSPKARTDLMIAAIPFALALAAKGLEALERHIAGRLVHLSELELAIAELGDQVRAGGVDLAAEEPTIRDDPGHPWEPSCDLPPPCAMHAGAAIAHPLGCVLDQPHGGECEFAEPDKVSVDDELVITQCRVSPGCTIPFPHEHAPNYGGASQESLRAGAGLAMP